MTREERTELIEYLKYNRSIGADYTITDKDADEIIKALEREHKTGHWINRHIIANTSIDMIVCSECGEEFSYDAETGISEYNYCPNCGAKMESEDKG